MGLAIAPGRKFAAFAAALTTLLASSCVAFPSTRATDPASPLHLQQAIILPDTHGRIDHMALDRAGRRLFVSEFANGTLDVIDLESGKRIARISGLDEPQGVGWVPGSNELVVACGGGRVRFYSGKDFHLLASLNLGKDADDVRIDRRNGRVVVGYGEGGLVAIDPVTRKVVAQVMFKGHPEGFQLSGGKAYVNDPDDGAILVVDLDHGKVLTRWPTGLHRFNFPMAIAPSGKTITVVYRLPAAWARIATANGKVLALHPSCGGADDVYLQGNRTMIVCGAGHVDLLRGDKLVARVTTRKGARTGLYDSATRMLYVALPKRSKQAAIWGLKLRPIGQGHSSP